MLSETARRPVWAAIRPVLAEDMMLVRDMGPSQLLPGKT
jgi:hypothetical protein